MMFLLNYWLVATGSPVAMLQHATSSQSITFHQVQVAPTRTRTSVTTTPQIIPNSDNQTKYQYRYEVSDHQTGDRKSHWEKREGDSVRGAYTLYEPDGAVRTVEYTADALHGFNAVVKRNEPSTHQHSQLNAGYKYKIPSNGDQDRLDELNQSYNLGREKISSKGTSRPLQIAKPYHKGVDFTVVHDSK